MRFVNLDRYDRIDRPLREFALKIDVFSWYLVHFLSMEFMD